MALVPGRLARSIEYERHDCALDLYRAAAGGRHDRVFESGQQNLADDLGDFGRVAGRDDNSGAIQLWAAAGAGGPDTGGIANRFCDPVGQNQEVHAQRVDADIDDSGAGMSAFVVSEVIQPADEAPGSAEPETTNTETLQ